MVERILVARKWDGEKGPFLRSTTKKYAFFPSMCLTGIATLAAIFLVLMSPSAASSSVTADETPSVYDILREFNFPVGLLPEGALGYDLDRTTGKFEAYLKGSCNFSPDDSYELKYKSTISGHISRDRLRDLKGVSVKFMFFWIDIVEVVRDGEDLEFSVGIASASFPADNFSECPRCGCGMDCNNNGKMGKLKTKSFISSI